MTMRRIFSLNQYITSEINRNGKLDDLDIYTIKTWATRLDGEEVEHIGDCVYKHGLHLIHKDWTIEVN